MNFVNRERGPRSDNRAPARSPRSRSAAEAPVQTARRPPGEPRRLLLDAARELFARKDYRTTTTREIAESGRRHRIPAVPPFRFEGRPLPGGVGPSVHRFRRRVRQEWQAVVPEETDEEKLARHFVGQLYDVLVEHRGLLLTLVASEASARKRSPKQESPTSGGRSGLSVRSASRACSCAGCARTNRICPRTRRGDDRRHGGIAVDFFRCEAASTRCDCRRTRPGDSAWIPAPRRLSRYGLAKPAAFKTFCPASPVTRSTNLPASS